MAAEDGSLPLQGETAAPAHRQQRNNSSEEWATGRRARYPGPARTRGQGGPCGAATPAPLVGKLADERVGLAGSHTVVPRLAGATPSARLHPQLQPPPSLCQGAMPQGDRLEVTGCVRVVWCVPYPSGATASQSIANHCHGKESPGWQDEVFKCSQKVNSDTGSEPLPKAGPAFCPLTWVSLCNLQMRA